MPKLIIRAPSTFERGFSRIRDELAVPPRFGDEVMADAEASTLDPGLDRIDARALPLVAIDPPGATDLDQAFGAERLGDGHRVHYAIADVGSFVTPLGPVDVEARARGATLYCPDWRAPLHPPVLSEDRASLLPGVDRPSLLWTIDLDGGGHPIQWRLERALVRVDAAISYARAQAIIDAAGTGEGTGGGPDPGLARLLTSLAEIGRRRQEREAERGGISINLPAQEVVAHDGSYTLEFDRSLPVEGWNAQISLLAGMVAARTMTDAGVGILRTLPPADPDAITQLRLTARALELRWPAEQDYADFVRQLAPDSAASNAFLVQATRTLRGAGYLAFAGDVPDHRQHFALATDYAHVTAPLRRLVDRFANEILVAVFADQAPPAWAVEALDDLPSLMGRARQRESALERALLDFAEAVVLEHSVGEEFHGFVVDLDRRRDRARIQIPHPAVVAAVDGDGRALGEELRLRLDAVDPEARAIDFHVLGPA